MTDPTFFPINPDEEREESQDPSDLFANRKSYFLQLPDVPAPDSVQPLPVGASQFPGLAYVRYIDGNTGEVILVELRSGETYIMPSSGVQAEYFVFRIDTTKTGGGSTASDQYYFPLTELAVANVEIEWGDGQTTTVVGTIPIGGTTELLHTYAAPGVYRIVAKPLGATPQLSMSSVTLGNIDKTKVIELEQWGWSVVSMSNPVLGGCINLTTLGVIDTPYFSSKVLSGSALNFLTGGTSLLDFSGWGTVASPIDVNNVSSLLGSNYGLGTSYNNVDVNWVTTENRSWAYAFFTARSFNRPLNNWRRPTSILGMFFTAQAFNQDLSAWDMSVCTSFASAFTGASSFNRNLGSWNISSMTSAIGMLSGSGISTANYDNLLVGWAAQAPNIQNNVTLSVVPVNYTPATSQAARDVLTGTYGWTIIDASFVGLLDAYPGAAAAYSLRLLRRGYSGSLIQVRRASDGTTQNIGYNNNFQLDTVALTSFCSGTNCFVRTWYDQSGFNNNAVQTVLANQPKLYDSVTGVVTENSKAALQFDGTDSFTPTSAVSYTDLTWFTVTKKTDTTGAASVIFFQDGTKYGGDDVDNHGNPVLYTLGGGVIRLSLNNTSASGGEVNQHLSYYNRSGTSASGGLNGEVKTPATVNTNAFVLNKLFDYGGAFTYNGKAQEIILYNSNQSANRTGIEQNINANYGIYWDGTQTGLLDTYPSAAAAYSVRALNSAYKGPILRVRRASDNLEQDIYALYNGELNVQALTTFCAGTDGFVRTWYDQSGNARNATQTTTANQPKIYDSATGLITEGGKAAIFKGTQATVLSLATALTNGANFLYALVHGPFSDYGMALGATFFGPRSGSSYRHDYDSLVVNQFQNTSVDTIANRALVVSQRVATTAGSVYTNGTITTGGVKTAGGTVNTTQTSIFHNDTNITAKIQEVIFWPSDQSSNRAGIETNINNAFTIYGQTPTGLLADYPGAAAAYSVRQLISTARYAMAVRRASDNAVLPIGFVNGDLDTTTLAAFCSGTNGFVAVWYDQSGKGNHATQTTTANQPKIYDSVTGVIAQNGEAAMQFNGTSNFLTFPAAFATNFYYSVFGVRQSSKKTGSSFLASDDTNRYWADIGQTSTQVTLQDGFNGPSASTDYTIYRKNGAPAFGAVTTRTSYSDAFFNGNQILMSFFTDGSADNWSFNSLMLGAYNGPSLFFEGTIQEFIMYQSTVQSQISNASAIETNINGYFNIY